MLRKLRRAATITGAAAALTVAAGASTPALAATAQAQATAAHSQAAPAAATPAAAAPATGSRCLFMFDMGKGKYATDLIDDLQLGVRRPE